MILKCVFVVAAMLLAAPAEASGEAPAAPGWMSGCWVETGERGWTEECWTGPRGGMMLGSGRAGKGDRVASWEAMQILPDAMGKIVYWSSPGGAPRVAFPMVSQGPAEAVFANPAHDYPQRIRYWREGGVLNAEISLSDGSKPQRWRYRRM